MFPDCYKKYNVVPEPHDLGFVLTTKVTDVCVDCGKERRCGDWPQCPHEAGVFGEEPMEPYVDVNLCTEPVLITTRAERRKIMSRQGMDYRKKRTDLLTGRRVHFDMGEK